MEAGKGLGRVFGGSGKGRKEGRQMVIKYKWLSSTIGYQVQLVIKYE